MLALIQSLGVLQSLIVFALFALATLNLGLAAQTWLTQTASPAVNVCLAVALGFLVLALIGLLVWIAPTAKRAVSVVLLLAANGMAAHLNWQNRKAVIALLHINTFMLGTWLCVSLALLILAQAPIPPRTGLPDGLYPFKRWTLPVRIQVMTLLPPDNALPAFAAEYMARGTSFARVRPLMPGQEVSNRPLYEALVYLPFRAVFGTTERAPTPYPAYDYIGTRWPDTSQLISDNSFAKFLAVAIPLNASLLLGFGALISYLSVPYTRLCLVTFGALSPYLWHHSIFTWPKNLAAFCLLLAMLLLLARGPPGLAGLFIGLAYLSHPYALAFLVAFGIATSVEIARQTLLPATSSVFGIALSKRQLVAIWLAIIAVILPWQIWTRLVLHVPSDSPEPEHRRRPRSSGRSSIRGSSTWRRQSCRCSCCPNRGPAGKSVAACW